MSEYEILFLNDLHTFSLWGLMPPEFEVEDKRTGNTIVYHQNGTQKANWEHWETMLGKINPDCIVLNGDICDGPAKHNMGSTVVSSNLSWQVEAATQIIQTLPDVPMYFTQGSGYHSCEERGQPLEQTIAENVGGTYGDELIIEECGIRIYARHTIGTTTSAWMYRTTPISKDMMILELNSAEDRYGHIDIGAFAHAHYFACSVFPHQLGFVGPCWQTRTPYAVKKGITSPTDVGWITAKIEKDGQIWLDRSGIRHIGRPCKVVGRG